MFFPDLIEITRILNFRLTSVCARPVVPLSVFSECLHSSHIQSWISWMLNFLLTKLEMHAGHPYNCDIVLRQLSCSPVIHKCFSFLFMPMPRLSCFALVEYSLPLQKMWKVFHQYMACKCSMLRFIMIGLILLAFAMTAHKAQGQSVHHVIIDLESCTTW
jgi:hypothetical protein